MQHGALDGDDPRPASGQGDIRVDRIVGVEVDEARLRLLNLLDFVGTQKVFELAAAQRAVRFVGGLDGLSQFGVAGGEALDGGVVQTLGADAAAVLAEFFQFLDRAHGASS